MIPLKQNLSETILIVRESCMSEIGNKKEPPPAGIGQEVITSPLLST